ncbi:MAG: hypothetical protein HY746_00935 [Elusimicrobia bacterium]|nr:hypothetical protein [Elusimicrobiota bacterium]
MTMSFNSGSFPYSRIVLMHVSIIAGAFAMQIFKGQNYILPVFMFLKTIIDLHAHLKERKNTGVACRRR